MTGHLTIDNMTQTIVFLDTATLSNGDIDFAPLLQLGKVILYDRTSQGEIVERCAEADIIITNKVVIDDSTMATLPNLKYICVAATGYNVVDVKSAAARGIPVSNVSGYSTPSVVQHTFAMILAALCRVATYSEQVHLGRWQAADDFTFYDHSITELAGKTMGILGLGTIGRQVARVAQAFGMAVLGVQRPSSIKDPMPGVRYVTLEELFVEADIVSLHAPLTDGNLHLVNCDLLSLMKPSAILVNTARGPLVHEGDLATALLEGHLAVACIDVLSQEPPTDGSPLIGLPNCLITPHQAWASYESRTRLLKGLVDNIGAFQSQLPLLNIVE